MEVVRRRRWAGAEPERGQFSICVAKVGRTITKQSLNFHSKDKI